MTQAQILLIRAIISFEKKANELINLLADEFELDLTAESPFSKLLTRSNNLWKGNLKNNWAYQFHGDACKFENTVSNQLLDVKINRNGHYGVISHFYLFEYIRTTYELNDVLKQISSLKILYTVLDELERDHLVISIGPFPFESRVLNHELLPKSQQ